MQSQSPRGTKEQTQVDKGSFMLRELQKNKGLGTQASCLLEEAGLWKRGTDDKSQDGEEAHCAAMSCPEKMTDGWLPQRTREMSS